MLDTASSSNPPHQSAWHRKPATIRPQRRNKSIAALLTITLHLLALWLIVRHQTDLPIRHSGGSDSLTTLLMIPDTARQAIEAPRPQSKPTAPPVKSPAKPSRRRQSPAIDATPRSSRAPQITPPTVALDKSLPAPEQPARVEAVPEEDFSARLANRQRQRAEAETQERAQQTARGTPEQQDNARGKEIALANIASQLRSAGLEKDDAGGLFQLQHVGPHHAEFLFRGWKKEARRNWSQQVDVEQGTEADIRIAVVKKMIDIIRQHTQADFTWNSHRLGQQIHLSARPEDAIGLQQFLLREFFPDFSDSRR